MGKSSKDDTVKSDRYGKEKFKIRFLAKEMGSRELTLKCEVVMLVFKIQARIALIT